MEFALVALLLITLLMGILEFGRLWAIQGSLAQAARDAARTAAITDSDAAGRAYAAYGGVYIAGGIVPDNIEQIQASTFRERFEDKNRYRHYMQAIPTYVITDPTPGLTGLTAYIVEHKGD